MHLQHKFICICPFTIKTYKTRSDLSMLLAFTFSLKQRNKADIFITFKKIASLVVGIQFWHIPFELWQSDSLDSFRVCQSYNRTLWNGTWRRRRKLVKATSLKSCKLIWAKSKQESLNLAAKNNKGLFICRLNSIKFRHVHCSYLSLLS